MISRKTLVVKFGWLILLGAPLCGLHAEEVPASPGELLEVRLEGEGMAHPVRLELALPTQGMASKAVGPLAQSVVNALRECRGLPELVEQARDALEIDLLFKNGQLSEAAAKHLDSRGVLSCALQKVQRARVSTFPLQATDLKGTLRIRGSEG